MGSVKNGVYYHAPIVFTIEMLENVAAVFVETPSSSLRRAVQQLDTF